MSKKWIYPLGLLIAVFIAFFMYQKFRVAPSINLASLDLINLKGEPVNMESFRGKKVILCFGASWCANCREELDMIAKIYEKELSGIEVVVISDETIEKIEHFKEKRAYNFVFLKMNKSFADIGIHSIPTSYLINTQLEIKKETVGYLNWNDASNREHFKKLMD